MKYTRIYTKSKDFTSERKKNKGKENQRTKGAGDEAYIKTIAERR